MKNFYLNRKVEKKNEAELRITKLVASSAQDRIIL